MELVGSSLRSAVGPADTTSVKLAGAAVLILVLVLVAGFAVYRKDGAASSEADSVRTCLQAAGTPATVMTSSTGQPQVAIAHGPVQIADHVTLQNSTTYISFLPSADEAAWWAAELRESPDIPDDSIVSSGNAFVQYSAGATSAVRAAVAGCLV